MELNMYAPLEIPSGVSNIMVDPLIEILGSEE